MAGWNGSGVFSVTYSWQDDQANGIAISSSRMDTQFTDVVNGINNSLTKDGQNNPSANLPMATYRHTGVSDGAALDEYLSVKQFQNGGVAYATSGGSSNAYTLTLSPAITSYTAGQRFRFKANHLSTGAATLNVSSLGAKNIKVEGLWDLSPYAIKNNQLVEVIYDGTQFQITNLGAVTGDIEMWSSSTVKPGWLVLDGTTTIGNSSSGADLASDAYEGLFKHIYDSTDNAEAAVSSGRGVDADTDWSANKTLTLPDTGDMSPYGIDTTLTKAFKIDGSETATPLGSITGSVSGTALTEDNLPSSVTVTVGTGAVDDAASNNFATASSVGSDTMSQTLSNFGSGSPHTHSDTFTFSGSSTDVLNPVFGTYFIIKI